MEPPINNEKLKELAKKYSPPQSWYQGNSMRKDFGCQCGIPNPDAYGVIECGQPVVAVWTWEDDPYKSVYVCQKHDEMIVELEEKDVDNVD